MRAIRLDANTETVVLILPKLLDTMPLPTEGLTLASEGRHLTIGNEIKVERGCREEYECVNIEGVPVRFLLAYNALLEEALAEAHETIYEATPTRVLRAEHLLAVALQTGRNKDRERVRVLREAPFDPDYLAGMLARHGLAERRNQWQA